MMLVNIEKNNKTNARKRRHKKVRSKIMGTSERPRLSVYRSNKKVRIQLIDDRKGHTLVAVSSVLSKEASPQEAAKKAGLELAEKAKKEGLKKVVFDRGGFAYHGRVKMVAEGAREGGLEF